MNLTKSGGQLQRKCAECEQEDKEKLGLARKESAGTSLQPPTAPPIVHDVLRSPGHPLDAAAKAFMEPRFGHDFNRVQVHTDELASTSAAAVASRAYTVGADVVFRQGEYSPATMEGRRLLAHELAHVIQQGMPGPDNQIVRRPADPGAAGGQQGG